MNPSTAWANEIDPLQEDLKGLERDSNCDGIPDSLNTRNADAWFVPDAELEAIRRRLHERLAKANEAGGVFVVRRETDTSRGWDVLFPKWVGNPFGDTVSQVIPGVGLDRHLATEAFRLARNEVNTALDEVYWRAIEYFDGRS